MSLKTIDVKISAALTQVLAEADTPVHAAIMIFAEAHVNERLTPLLIDSPLVMIHQDGKHCEPLAVSVEYAACPDQLLLLTYEEAFTAGLIPTEGLL